MMVLLIKNVSKKQTDPPSETCTIKKILRDDMGFDIYTMYICRSYLKIFQNNKKYISPPRAIL